MRYCVWRYPVALRTIRAHQIKKSCNFQYYWLVLLTKLYRARRCFLKSYINSLNWGVYKPKNPCYTLYIGCLISRCGYAAIGGNVMLNSLFLFQSFVLTNSRVESFSSSCGACSQAIPAFSVLYLFPVIGTLDYSNIVQEPCFHLVWLYGRLIDIQRSCILLCQYPISTMDLCLMNSLMHSRMLGFL